MKTLTHTFFVVLFLASTFWLGSCTDDNDVINSDMPALQEIPVELSATLVPFDANSPASRATTISWKYRDAVYILFTMADGAKVSGKATCTSAKTWTVTYPQSANLKRDATTKCEVYYFDGTAKESGNTVELSASTGVYADKNASYFYPSGGKLHINCAMTPQTSRLRFKGEVGKKLYLSGVSYGGTYSMSTATVSNLTNTVELEIKNDGYTPYVYGTFANSSAPQLKVKYDGMEFVANCQGKSIFKTGESGWMFLPTKTSYGGWTLKDHAEEEYVDLGLPSGTLWATCNVGANSPEESGDYFAWGEVSGYDDGKLDFSWKTYSLGDGTDITMKKYCLSSSFGTVDNMSQLIPSDDAAYKNWGKTWSLPTAEQVDELTNGTYTTSTWTTLNGVYGQRITSKTNSKTIFLPAAGYMEGTTRTSKGTNGYYWSSSLHTTNSNQAHALGIKSDGAFKGSYYRYRGQSIRPVVNSNTQTFTANGVSFNMKLVEAGTFQMGKSADNNDVTPVHAVTISKDYYIGVTEVTQALWKAVTGYSPTSDGNAWSSTYGLGDNYPAYGISYNDVQEFITKLNQLTGQKFRMPTEAEWEFAAKGGNASKGYIYSGSNIIGDVAWYSVNSSKTHLVKTKAPNELGIYDMTGNVSEWCSDWYGVYTSTDVIDPKGNASGSYHVLRGGSWSYASSNCSCVVRSSNTPTYSNSGIGFRLAL